MGLYVCYEDGVYRHTTISVSANEEDVFETVLEYFKSTDDYHVVTVEHLEAGKRPEHICEYSVKSMGKVDIRYVNFNKREVSRSVRHGERVVYKDGVEFYKFTQDYILKDGESFCGD